MREDNKKDSEVYIRILELEDIPRTQAWLNDESLGEIMGYLPHSLLHQQDWFRKATIDQGRFIFAICEKDGDRHIGNVALGNIDYIHRNAMFSIFIAEQNLRGRGYGRVATRLALDFGFNRLNLNKIFLRTSAEYQGALDFYRSLGFVQEGVLRKHEFKYGEYRDKYLFGMLKEEYLQNIKESEAQWNNGQ